MKDEWKAMTLGEFVTLQRGHDLTEPERNLGKIPVMGSAAQNGFHDTARAKGPGIVIGRSGASFGQVHYSPCDYWPHNTTLYVTDFKGNDPKFTFYFLKAIDFSRYNSGSAQPSLNRNFIYPIPIRVPLLSQQKRIAHILGTLDDKIELNSRMNATLEMMARALFQNSFGDQIIEALPTGWSEGSVDHLASFSRGTLSPAKFPDEIFAHYSLPAFDKGRVPSENSGSDIKSNKTLVPKNSVLISKLNPRIPRIWLPSASLTNRSISSTEFLVFIPKKGITCEFLYCLFINELFMNTLATMVTGASGSHQRIKPDSLLSMSTVIPSKTKIREFTETVGPLLQKIQSNIYQSQTLAALRATLLPKLLSGEATPTAIPELSPKIGASLAGGEWPKITANSEKELADEDATLVESTP